jgi:hypothetical protein
MSNLGSFLRLTFLVTFDLSRLLDHPFKQDTKPIPIQYYIQGQLFD